MKKRIFLYITLLILLKSLSSLNSFGQNIHPDVKFFKKCESNGCIKNGKIVRFGSTGNYYYKINNHSSFPGKIMRLYTNFRMEIVDPTTNLVDNTGSWDCNSAETSDRTTTSSRKNIKTYSCEWCGESIEFNEGYSVKRGKIIQGKYSDPLLIRMYWDEEKQGTFDNTGKFCTRKCAREFQLQEK
jgi:hypothetical protein